LDILQFLNLIGIVNQSFLTAFTSQWSKTSSYIQDLTLNRFIFAIIFEVSFLSDVLIMLGKIIYRKISNSNKACRPCSMDNYLRIRARRTKRY
jgi:hypothetical protein